MATWQELVTRQPSFKGIPFVCRMAETEFGRKFQDQAEGGAFASLASLLSGGDKADEKKDTSKRTAVVDQGILPKKITVTGEFFGDTYNQTRDLFMAAIEAGGLGKLVLPTYNVFQNAIAERGTMRFSDQRGGVESFTVTFVIQGELTSPGKAKDTRGGVKANANQSKQSGSNDFETNSVVSGVESVFDEVVADIDNFVEASDEALKSGAVKTDETYDDAVGELSAIEDSKEALAADPEAQAVAYNAFLETISGAFTTAESGFTALLSIASSYAGKIQVVTGAGPLAISRAKNRIAGLIFIQNACISNAALLLRELDFAVVDDVQRVRDTFGAAVRDLQATIGSTSGFAETYRDLIKLNAAVFDDLVQRTAALPVLEQRTILASTPTLTYAYKKYGDADRINEILRRNDIKRSLFASGELELLSR